MEAKEERQLGVELFNFVWSLLDRTDRTAELDLEMLHAAHASRHHWGKVGNAQHLSVGEWQISRVYATLGRAEPAMFHAVRAVEYSEREGVAAFAKAWAFEAVARAAALQGDLASMNHNILCAREFAPQLEGDEDRRRLADDLESVQKLVNRRGP
jgi:hypothetical protein